MKLWERIGWILFPSVLCAALLGYHLRSALP